MIKVEDVYRASDGTIFIDEAECCEYELNRCINELSDIKFFNKSNELIPINNTIDLEKAYMTFRKVIIPTKEDYNNLMDVFNFLGLDDRLIPHEGNFYDIYNFDTGEEIIISEEDLISDLKILKECIDLK